MDKFCTRFKDLIVAQYCTPRVVAVQADRLLCDRLAGRRHKRGPYRFLNEPSVCRLREAQGSDHNHRIGQNFVDVQDFYALGFPQTAARCPPGRVDSRSNSSTHGSNQHTTDFAGHNGAVSHRGGRCGNDVGLAVVDAAAACHREIELYTEATVPVQPATVIVLAPTTAAAARTLSTAAISPVTLPTSWTSRT